MERTKKVKKALSKELLRMNIVREDRELVLKPQQAETTGTILLHGRNMLAVSPDSLWQKHDSQCFCTRQKIIVVYEGQYHCYCR